MMGDGINPVQSGAVLNVDSETVRYVRSEPPPYTPWDQNSAPAEPPVVHQTIIIQPQLKDSPIYFHCPKCHERVLTRVEHKNSKKTHMLAGFICGFTLWCMLCFFAAIPYLLPMFKKTEHYCPNCNLFLGQHSKL